MIPSTPRPSNDLGAADNPSTILARFPRADAGQPTEVRVYVQRWGERLLVHARWFTKAKSADTWHPTPKGATFRPEDLPELEAAIVEARRLLGSEVEPASAEDSR